MLHARVRMTARWAKVLDTEVGSSRGLAVLRIIYSDPNGTVTHASHGLALWSFYRDKVSAEPVNYKHRPSAHINCHLAKKKE